MARVDKVGRNGGIMGSLLGGVGLGAGLGAFNVITGAIGSVADLAGRAIDAASDLNESLSKSQVVFGDNAKAIEDWADTAATSVGLSKQAALEATGTFGNLFDALKLSEDATRDMSKGAVQLAADLASFNNVGLEDTLAAIQSGLLGEAEPMRRFGSNLSAARVEAYALAKGWVRNAKSLTDAMKVQARYALILEDTKNAQGDFVRTSDGLANSQRILSAELDDVVATLGQELVPVALTFANVLKDDVVPGVKGLIETIKDAKDSGILDAVLSLFQAGIDPSAPLRAGVQLGANLVKGMQAGVKEWTPELLNSLRSADDEIADEVQAHVTAIVQVWNSLPSQLSGEALEQAKDAFISGIDPSDRIELLGRGIPESLRKALAPAVPAALKAGRKAGQSFGHGIQSARDEVTDASKALKYALDHPFDGEAEKKKILGQLLGRRIARGIKESRKDPRVRDATQAYIDAQVARLETLKAEGYDVGYELGIALGKGLEANPVVQEFRKLVKGTKSTGIKGLTLYDLIETSAATGNRTPTRKKRPKGHADGLDRVPFDGYPAILHRNEAVLRAQDAAVWRSLSLPRFPPPQGASWADVGAVEPTVRHQGTVYHQVSLSPESIAAMRAQGASWADVGRVAGAASATIASPAAVQSRWEDAF